MSEFYCSGCSKWARNPHYCPGREYEGKPKSFVSEEEHQRANLLRRKAELERELKEINLRLGGVE